MTSWSTDYNRTFVLLSFHNLIGNPIAANPIFHWWANATGTHLLLKKTCQLEQHYILQSVTIAFKAKLVGYLNGLLISSNQLLKTVCVSSHGMNMGELNHNDCLTCIGYNIYYTIISSCNQIIIIKNTLWGLPASFFLISNW